MAITRSQKWRGPASRHADVKSAGRSPGGPLGRFARMQVARFVKALRSPRPRLNSAELKAVATCLRVIAALDRYHELASGSRRLADRGPPVALPTPPEALTFAARRLATIRPLPTSPETQRSSPAMSLERTRPAEFDRAAPRSSAAIKGARWASREAPSRFSRHSLFSARRQAPLGNLYLADRRLRGALPSVSAWAVSPRRSLAFVRRKCCSFSFGVC